MSGVPAIPKDRSTWSRTRKRLTVGLIVGGLLAAAVSNLLPANAAESNGGVRIMPLGDSITDGTQTPGGYRISLWQQLTATGARIDFVGSLANGPGQLGDHDHEGHSGWRIDQIDANINTWLRNTTPRTVLLHIGTNDILQNNNVSGAPNRLSALIDKIRAADPGVYLFVAQITRLNNQGQDAAVRQFNSTIPGIVQGKGGAGSRIYTVDMYNALTTGDLVDGVHPTAGGYGKMANAWNAAMRQVPASYQDAATTTTTTTTTTGSSSNPFQRGPDPTVANIAANNGPFATAQTSVPAGSGFGGGVIYYPTDASQTYGGLAIMPGFSAKFANEEAWMGPRLASYGFVVIGVETNTTSDGADSRATQLLAALDYLTRTSSVRTRVDPNRLAVMGHSAGGAGTVLAASQRPSLKAAIGLAPGTPGSLSMANVRVPFLIQGGLSDPTVTPSYLDNLYGTLPTSVPSAYLQITGADHGFFTRANNVELRTQIPWLKIFVDNDTRYTKFLCPSLADNTSISRYTATCSLIPGPGSTTTTTTTTTTRPITTTTTTTTTPPTTTTTTRVTICDPMPPAVDFVSATPTSLTFTYESFGPGCGLDDPVTIHVRLPGSSTDTATVTVPSPRGTGTVTGLAPSTTYEYWGSGGGSPFGAIRTGMASTLELGSTTTTTTTTTTSASVGGCTATYTSVGSWPGGFQGQVTVTAGASSLSQWSVQLTLPAGASTSNLWSGTPSGTSGSITVANAPYNGSLGAGQSTNFGFVANGAGTPVVTGCSAG